MKLSNDYDVNNPPPNVWADFWRYEIGINVIPADTQFRLKYPNWSEWKDKLTPQELHEKWKKENAFEKGMAILPGKIWFREDKKNLYLVFIDLDNQKAIDEICSIFGVKNLQELSKIVIVEQHKDDLTRAHIYFYSTHIFKKKSSDASKYKKEIKNNDIPAIEVKGLGSQGIAFCSNSKHKNGHRYDISGTTEPQIFGKEIEDRLFDVYQKYCLNVDKNGKISIEKLFEEDYIVSEGHNRHEALLRIMESLIQRNKEMISKEQIRQLAWEWNQKHCSPPLDDKEVARQWIDALRFISKKNDEIDTTRKEEKKEINENSNVGKQIYKIIQQTPSPCGYYIDQKNHEIRFGIKYDDQFISKKSIMDVIPTHITIYNNPLFPKLKPIEIKFSNGLKIGPFNNITDVLKELENRGHILNRTRAPDALNCIVSAMKQKGLVKQVSEVTTSGYYLINNVLLEKNVTQTKEIKKEDAIKCCKYLNELAENGWKDKAIFPTVIKWGLISPFSFIIKYCSNTENWVPWIQLYGHSQTGKTTLGKIILSIWNLDIRSYSIGFNHIDSVARFGNVVSRDTYPKLVNEVGALSNNSFGKYTNIIEMIKHSVESPTVRGKYVDNTNTHNTNSYQDIPALSPMIFTSNHQPLNDSGYNRRMVSIHLGEDEKKEIEQQELFRKLFEENRSSLKTLGYFTSCYLENEPSQLFKKPWKELVKDILKKFYEYGELEIPQWIEYYVEQRDAVDESSEKTYFGLRSILVNKINETYSKYSRINGKDELDQIHNTIESRLKSCLENQLITYLHKSSEFKIAITIDIMNDIKQHNLENITSLKDVGALLGIRDVNKRFNGRRMRLLEGSINNLVSFLESNNIK